MIHAHAPHVQTLFARGLSLDASVLVEEGEMLGPVQWVGRYRSGSADLARAVASALELGRACVLDGHGAVTVGSTIREAESRMLMLDRLAMLTVAARGGE